MRPYASATTRMRAYIAYAEAIPQAMENIRANLAGPLPRTYVDLGRTVFGGLAKFYEQYAPEAFASVQDEKLVARFKTANAGAIAAARALDTWLESRRSTAGDDFALGSERFSEMLRASEQLDVSIDRLEQLGRDDLDRNRAALGEACATFAPGKTVNDCVAVIQARKPNPGPVEVASDQLPELRRFVENQQLVTIPGGEEAQLIEAPPQLRWNPAGIILSGGLERRDVPSFYYVTPADASWNEAERKAYIVDVESLRIISVHEVWPGHFLHSQHAYRAPSVLARIFWNNCTSEGWAHYTEEMMVDAGLGSTDGGETRIAQLLQALVRNVRFLSAIGLHTGRMSLADSEQMFREKAFYDSAGARQQAARGTFDPAYLDYTLGKLMIRKLREDWTSTRGGRDAWHAFHDEFLSYGAPPIPLVRAAMLGPDAGPPL